MSHKNILVMDDEEDICEVVACQLRIAGYNVFTATRLEAALKVIDSEDLGLIVSDVTMEGGGGLELLDQLKKSKQPQLPVIIMSGYSDEILDEAQKKGAYCILNKPLSIQLLKQKISEILDN